MGPPLRLREKATSGSLSDGLVHWWPLSQDSLTNGAAGSPYDFGTQPIYGTAGAGVTFDSGGPSPKIKDALAFDGSATGHIALSAAALPAGFAFAQAHSIFLWVKITNRDGIGTSGSSQTFLGLQDASSGFLRFGNDDGGGGAFFVSSTVASLPFESTYSIDTLNNGRWSLIGYTWDGSTSIPYGNGAPTGKQSTTNFSNTGGVNVIGSYGGINGSFTGSFADIRIYNRTLSPAEVFELYVSAFTPEVPDLPVLFVAAAGGFIPAWALNSNLPVIGTGTY